MAYSFEWQLLYFKILTEVGGAKSGRRKNVGTWAVTWLAYNPLEPA